MDESVPASPKHRVRVVGHELGYGLRFLRKHACRIVLWFVCLLLPRCLRRTYWRISHVRPS
jgi:hypothetical protein